MASTTLTAEPKKLANPAALGLAGFGLTTVLLSLLNAGALPADTVNAIIPLAFAYGGAAQLVAGILEYGNGNTFGTVAFISYGMFWWWFALMNWTIGAGWMKPPSGTAVGITLLLWGIFTLYMWIPTFKMTRALWLIFLTLWVTFFLLAAGEFTGGGFWAHAGGDLGVLCGALALYASFAIVTNETFGRVIIPVGEPQP